MERNNSPAKCPRLPVPTEAKVSFSRRDSAMTSPTDCAGSGAGTISTDVTVVTVVIGAKSLTVS